MAVAEMHRRSDAVLRAWVSFYRWSVEFFLHYYNASSCV